ncbi:unnamed protein product [Aureobasidium pullulans]|nr:unnamed protein product [Aureobasidium pullulans]
MSDTTPQQKANLARIRDNQRRSRARRKEYLQELETKYRSCEAVGAEASAEIQAAARKVLDENKRLRRLLRQQGFSDADIDGPDHDEYASSPSAVEMLDLLDWDMAAAEAMPQSGTYTTPGTYASPTAGYPTAASFASPTPTVSTGYNTQDNTSSCFTAADAIRTLHVDAGPEVETALGCRDGTRDCRVNNSMVFDLMDRYAGAQGQQSGM